MKIPTNAWLRRAAVGIVAVVTVVVLSPGNASTNVEAVGDRTQVALPVAAAVCSLGRRAFTDTLVRFAGMQAVIQTSKSELGTEPINIRPNGNRNGFPSGHTAAAFFGATALARTCFAESPPGQILVFATAAFTGYSRIEAGKHFLFQVLAGALLGFAGDRSFRRPFSGLRRVVGWLRRRPAPAVVRR